MTNLKERVFKIYCLKHPESNEIRYIGVTCRNLNERLAQHYHSGIKLPLSTPISKWINSLRKSELKPIIELIENVSQENWEEKEIYYISEYSKTNNLLNISTGGKGLIIGKTREQANINIINAHKKKICQLDTNGKLIKEWNSITEATKYFGFKSKNAIGNAVSRTYRGISAGGFWWQYLEDYNNGIKIKSHKSKEYLSDSLSKGIVYMFDVNCNQIGSFKSVTLAANYLDVYSSAISESIKRSDNSKYNLVLEKYMFSRKPIISINYKYKIINTQNNEEFRFNSKVQCADFLGVSRDKYKSQIFGPKENWIEFNQYIIQKL